jgi:phosphate-selective porin OprO/OprP
VSRLEVDGKAFTLGLAEAGKSASSAHAYTVGLSWYLNRNVKHLLNYVHTTFEGGAASGNRSAENALQFRLQLAY